MKNVIPILLAVLASPANAEGTRQLDSHEHGVGELNIAFSGSTIAMELHAPGADIVGFEYAAQSAKDRAAVDAAVAALARPLDLFVLPTAAECSVVQASASLESDDGHDTHDAHDAHEEGHEEDHAENHADESHEVPDHSGAASHTEFHAAYTLECGDAAAVSEITFAYFDVFQNARELEVQIVSEAGARAIEVERSNPNLDLRNMF